MKITIGGSFHEPGWSKVSETAEKLRKAGHTILFPKENAKPIDSDDNFVRFSGETEIKPQDLEMGFLSTLQESDAFVIVDIDGYIGGAVSSELGYATALATSELLQNQRLKKIYFTEQPMCCKIFADSNAPTCDEFVSRLYTDPAYSNVQAYFLKYREDYEDEADCYYDLINLKGWINNLEQKQVLKIGIDELLNREIENEVER